MKIEMHALECQHPFGPHIHIVMPNEKKLLNMLLDGFGIRPLIDRDLSKLEKLATAEVPANKCTAYKLAEYEEAWAVIALRAKADSTFALRALFVRIDPECEIEGIDVVEMMRVQLAKAMMMYGDK